jgi:diaminopimelate decarboxylase
MNPENLQQIAQNHGTPLFVYHAEKIEQQFEILKNAFPKNTRIFYACKALSNIHVLALMKQLGACLDCVSINEVKLGIMAGFEPKDIIFTPNGVHFSEIEEACQLGVLINLDQTTYLQQFAEKFGNTYPIFIRLKPNILAGGNLKISTGHKESKFGISLEALPEIIEYVKTKRLKIEGLHMHTGSEIADEKVYLQMLDMLLDISIQFPDLQYLDLGGGFKVAYKPSEKNFEAHALSQKIDEKLSLHHNTHGKSYRICIEPGKFLVAQAGYLICECNGIKENENLTFAFVNTGFNHLIRPMFYGSYHDISVLNPHTTGEQKYNVVGHICETDCFAQDRLLPNLKEGSLLAIHNAGAYGFEMSSNFNSRLKPAEILWQNDTAILIRHAQKFEDLLANQVELKP